MSYPTFYLCRTCKTKRMAVDGRVKCCGHDEAVEEIEDANRPSRLRGRSLEDMVFILEHNTTPEEAFRFHFGDDADADIPNR